MKATEVYVKLKEFVANRLCKGLNLKTQSHETA